jgi:hypothetical protein
MQYSGIYLVARPTDEDRIRARPVATAGRMEEGMRSRLARNVQRMACRREMYTRTARLRIWPDGRQRTRLGARTRNLSANTRLIPGGEGWLQGMRRIREAAQCLNLQVDRLLRENGIHGVAAHGRHIWAMLARIYFRRGRGGQAQGEAEVARTQYQYDSRR